jgi:hypothetical protein
VIAVAAALVAVAQHSSVMGPYDCHQGKQRIARSGSGKLKVVAVGL